MCYSGQKVRGQPDRIMDLFWDFYVKTVIQRIEYAFFK